MPIGTMRRHRKRALELAEARAKGEIEDAETETQDADVTGIDDAVETASPDTVEAAKVEQAESEPEPEPSPEPTALPESFPGYEELVLAGFDTYESLNGVTQDELMEINGIGKVTASRILEALAEYVNS